MGRFALAALAALLCAAGARAAGVVVDAPVVGGSTLAVTALNAPSFAVTLNGSDQVAAYQAQLQVVDARGLATGGGWNLTVSSTRFTGGGSTLPADASTLTSVTASCHVGSTCALPANTASNSNVALPVTPTTAKVLNAGSGSGLGRVDVDLNVAVSVPASTRAASYSSTVTVAISAGP
ncbi:MAG TPA: WxL domain-containing protein [Gaiellaceae bacterium]|nr:WxL domain-containing protein [Gaiellaceae bacterium]